MHITSLKLSDITVENSTGYAVLGVNILGNSSISHSSFIFNNYYTLSSTNCSYGRGTCRGGNIYLYYGSTVSASTNVISIDTCLFSDGVDISEGPQSSGLSIYALQYRVDVSIYNVVSTRNIAKTANFLFRFLRGYIGTLRIIKTTSSMANYLYTSTRNSTRFSRIKILLWCNAPFCTSAHH